MGDPAGTMKDLLGALEASVKAARHRPDEFEPPPDVHPALADDVLDLLGPVELRRQAVHYVADHGWGDEYAKGLIRRIVTHPDRRTRLSMNTSPASIDGDARQLKADRLLQQAKDRA